MKPVLKWELFKADSIPPESIVTERGDLQIFKESEKLKFNLHLNNNVDGSIPGKASWPSRNHNILSGRMIMRLDKMKVNRYLINFVSVMLSYRMIIYIKDRLLDVMLWMKVHLLSGDTGKFIFSTKNLNIASVK